jgi:putative phosphoribosyl transferase
MYFKDRQTAGRLLAGQIAKKYRSNDCVVIALSDGGVIVGAQIAIELGCAVMLMTSETIDLPREPNAIGGITPDGSFTYNTAYSPSQLDELALEYHNLIEQEKMQQVRRLNEKSSQKMLLRRDLIDDRTVLLVSDGLQDGFSLDMSLRYLKPIRIQKVVMATPLASVPAVDWMHMQTDEIYCLNVITDYISTDHYYDQPDIPDHDEITSYIDGLLQSWK